MRGPSRGADPRTVKEVVVKTEVYYIDEENHAREDKKVDFFLTFCNSLKLTVEMFEVNKNDHLERILRIR